MTRTSQSRVTGRIPSTFAYVRPESFHRNQNGSAIRDQQGPSPLQPIGLKPGHGASLTAEAIAPGSGPRPTRNRAPGLQLTSVNKSDGIIPLSNLQEDYTKMADPHEPEHFTAPEDEGVNLTTLERTAGFAECGPNRSSLLSEQ